MALIMKSVYEIRAVMSVVSQACSEPPKKPDLLLVIITVPATRDLHFLFPKMRELLDHPSCSPFPFPMLQHLTVETQA